MGAIGLLCCIMVAVSTLPVVLWIKRNMEAYKVRNEAKRSPRVLRRLLSALMVRRYKWKSSDPLSNHEDRHVALILQEYRLVWFFVLDTMILLVIGVLAGVAQASGEVAVCAGCGLATTVLYLIETIVCAIKRPFTTTFGHVYCILTLVLSALSVALQTANLIMQWGGSTDYDTLNNLLVSSSVCDLCIIGISILRLVMDLLELFHALRRLVTCHEKQLTNHSEPELSAMFLEFKNNDDGEVDEKSALYDDSFDMMLIGNEDAAVAPDFLDGLSFERGNGIDLVLEDVVVVENNEDAELMEKTEVKKANYFEKPPPSRISSSRYNYNNSGGGGGKSGSLLMRRSSSVRAAATKRTNSMMVNSSHTDSSPTTKTTDVAQVLADEQQHVVAGKHHWLTTIPVAVDESTVELNCILEVKLAGGDQYPYD